MPRKPLNEAMKKFVHGQQFDDLNNVEVEDPVKNNIKFSIEEDTVSEFKREKKNEPGARVRITIDLPKPRHRKLKQLVAELDTDMNALVNRVIEKIVGV